MIATISNGTQVELKTGQILLLKSGIKVKFLTNLNEKAFVEFPNGMQDSIDPTDIVRIIQDVIDVVNSAKDAIGVFAKIWSWLSGIFKKK